MKRRRLSTVSRWAAAMVVAGTSFGVCRIAVAQDRPPDVQEGVQVLTRGPVHEGFAETVSFNPDPGIIVNRSPPPSIEEVPPDQRPEGANVAWISGYWAWDDERDDFLWVSGVWRAMPPDREWVPGYWGRVDVGFQWISGYWADARVSETIYLSEPPVSVEAGPNIAPPSRDHIWAPGCWVWHENRYAWRPGYWVAVSPDWIWVPARYVYSPRGYVFCEGYWDHAIETRGVLFAPVYFETAVYTRPTFRYSPLIAINLSVFTDHLFVRPSCHQYYFGDYYAPRYYDRGIYASFTFNFSSYGYDPICVNDRYRHRDDRDWDRSVRQTFLRRREHEEARPPRTLAIQTALTTKNERSGDRSLLVATSFDEMAKSKDRPMRVQSVAKEEKQEYVKRGRDMETFRGERRKLEATSSGTPAVKASKPDSRPADSPVKASKPDNKPADSPVKASKPDSRPADSPVKASKPDSKPADSPDKANKPDGKPADSPDKANKPDRKPADSPVKASKPDSRPADSPDKANKPDRKPADSPDKANKPDNKPANSPDKANKPDKARLPKSPIVAKPADQLAKGKAPPKNPEPPKPDTKVEAKPKRNDGGRPDPPQANPNEDDSTDKSKVKKPKGKG